MQLRILEKGSFQVSKGNNKTSPPVKKAQLQNKVMKKSSKST